MPMLERMLRRDRSVTLLSLSALCALTWVYVAMGAGLGMPAWEMTTLALLPHREAMPAVGAMSTMAMPASGMGSMPVAWSPGYWALVIAMWWTMMIAMMAPSAAPAILLHARVQRHAQAQGRTDHAAAANGMFAAGYFLVWLAFSVAATALQLLLQHNGMLSTMMGSQVQWLSGSLLLLTGLYQLSPLKNTCLSHCRSPAHFLSRHWRPGLPGAVRLGTLHGTYCIGCCWMLMALLFVGGVMNLAWIAALTLLVLAEKQAPWGRRVGQLAGLLLVAWGITVLLA